MGDGALRFDPVMGKYIRMSVGGDGDDPAFGWAELRVRFAEEPLCNVPIETSEDSVQEDIVTYSDVDYTALREAIAAVDALTPSDYTEESWHAVQNFYDAAVAMQDGTYPQNAVTVAAWKLMDSLKGLNLATEDSPAHESTPDDVVSETVNRPKRRINKRKLILPAAVLAAGSIAGIAAAVLLGGKRKRKKK